MCMCMRFSPLLILQYISPQRHWNRCGSSGTNCTNIFSEKNWLCVLSVCVWRGEGRGARTMPHQWFLASDTAAPIPRKGREGLYADTYGTCLQFETCQRPWSSFVFQDSFHVLPYTIIHSGITRPMSTCIAGAGCFHIVRHCIVRWSTCSK